MSSGSPALYTPLDGTRKAIRTIQVLPGEDLPISCSFHSLQLGDFRSPPFTALSYTWGKRSPTAAIQLEGHLVSIRQNLWSALWSIRERINNGTWDDCGSQLLWIDAICIDQENINERNHQVNMMQAIYAQASVVVVWLGETIIEEGSNIALQYIKNANHRLENPTVVRQELSSGTLNTALLSLFRRDYWRRVWIVQEFLLATDIVVLCGKHSCKWSELARFYRSLGAASLSRNPFLGGINDLIDPILTSSAGQIISNRLAWQTSRHSYSLDDLLIMWPEQECEDARDRVFGMLGLVSSSWSHITQISADYSKDGLQLYKEVLQQVSGPLPSQSDTSRVGFTTLLSKLLELDIENLSLIEKHELRRANSLFWYGRE